MRHYMTDPDNEERLLKISPSVVAAIKAEAYMDAMDAVAAIPAPYKIRGDFETFGPYHEGRADFKDAATSAIDALREDRQTPPPLPPSVGVPERRWT